MCGIIAFKSKKKTTEHVKILLKLIHESKIRGLHSFGYSYYEGGKIITVKSFRLPTNLNDFDRSTSKEFIFHNRYSTSGDWKVENNIQPITIGDVSIAMNGVVSMKPRIEYEKEYNIHCSTENDSEIFLRLLEMGVPPVEVINKISGSCAVVWLIKNKIYAIRNSSRPLHFFRTHDAIFVCSTADIAKRAVGAKTSEIESYKLFELNKYV